jgi:hypothetical protein
MSEPASQSGPKQQWTTLSTASCNGGQCRDGARGLCVLRCIQLRGISGMPERNHAEPSKARTPGSGMIRYDYGTIAVTSLEYALSWLEEFKAVTT